MRIRATLFLAAAASLLSSCGGDRSAVTGETGGTVILSMGGDAATLFPALVQDETGKLVAEMVFDHLAEIGDSMSTIGDAGFQPRIAKSWDWGRDSMSIAFHVDPAARFHDGVAVHSNDVRYSYQITMDSVLATPVAPLLGNIDSVSTPDSLTAIFWFKKHLPEEFYDVAYQLQILPEHIYGKVKPVDMRTSEVLRHPVGSGRFRFVRWEPGSRIELQADTANYRGRAKLDRVVLVVGVATSAAAAAVLTGESDFYSAFPLDQAGRLDSSTVAHGIPYAQMAYGYMGMNLHVAKSRTQPHPVLSDKAMRRAISMAVDRRAMLANVFNHTGIPLYGPFPTVAASADTTLQAPPYDTTAAKALLDSAGWKMGPNGVRQKNGRTARFEIMVPSSSAIRMQYGDLIQEQLRRIGIQAELAKIPAPNFYGRLEKSDFDAFITLLNTDPSAGGAKQYWGADGVKSGTNYLTYSNPRVDAMLDSATLAATPAASKRYARAAYAQIMADVPGVWLYSSSALAGANRRINTAPFRPDGWFEHLADWSIPADKRIARDRIGLTAKTP